MAELNARIIAKASATASEEPQASDLEVAELAVNTADGKLFTKHTDGSVVTISGDGGAVDSVNGEIGVVSLGIQEMDDFELNSVANAGIVTFGTFNTTWTDWPANETGHWRRIATDQALAFTRYSDTGVDVTAPTSLGDTQIGDEIQITYSDGKTYIVSASSVLELSANGNYYIAVGTPSAEEAQSIAASDAVVIKLTKLIGADLPLANGDILQWSFGKFKPAQLGDLVSTPVDSVNGETGAVVLGIQDMDDYEYSPDSFRFNVLYRTVPGPGEIGTSNTTDENYLYISKTDQDGKTVDLSLLQADVAAALADPNNVDFPSIYNLNGAFGTTSRSVYRVNENATFYELLITGNPVEGTGGRGWPYANCDSGCNPLTNSFPDGAKMVFGVLTPPNGNVLQWSDTDQKFKPAQLPAGVVPPVDSVNGETGAVVLGIQDMDDYKAPGSATWSSRSNVVLTNGAAEWNYYNSEVRVNKSSDANNVASTAWLSTYLGQSIIVTAAINGGTSFEFTATVTESTEGSPSWWLAVTAGGSNFSGISDGDSLALSESGIQDGDILQWDEVDQKFKPTRLPSTSTSWSVTADGTANYIFAGDGFAGTETDPVLYVVRGKTYEITNSMGAHPFQIQSTSGIGGTAYNDGIANNAVSNGTLVWEVRLDAPAELYYQCTAHADMGGTIQVLENSASFGGGAVDSVNGETGVVSLGIQEMDDFELYPDLSGLATIEFDSSIGYTSTGGVSNGMTGGRLGAALNRTSYDGQTTATFFSGHLDGDPYWYSIDGGLTWSQASGKFSSYINEYWIESDSLYYLLGKAGNTFILTLTRTNPVGTPDTPLAEGDILQWVAAEQKFKPAQLPAVVDKATLQTEVAASTDFADFQARIAAL